MKIVRTTFIDRCMIFMAGMVSPTILMVLSGKMPISCFIFPFMLIVFVFSKKFKQSCNGKFQKDGQSILWDVIPVNVKNDTICVLNKKLGIWIGKYEVDDTPFFQKRIGLFWADGTLVKRNLNREKEFIVSVALDMKDGDSVEKLADELVDSLKNGTVLEDDEYIHNCTIPRFSSAIELDMKLNLFG